MRSLRRFGTESILSLIGLIICVSHGLPTDCPDSGFEMYVIGEGGYYIYNCLMSLSYYRYLKTRMKENFFI